MIYRGLVLGHLLGDFYLQNDEMVRRKKKEKDILNLHCTVYCLIVAVCSFWFVPSVSGGSYLIYLMVLMATHWGIDYAKNHLNKKDGQCFAFIADQAAHLAILIIPARFFAGSQSVLLYKSVLDCRPWIPVFNVVICMLICGKPASVLVRVVFEDIKTRGRGTEGFYLDGQDRDTQDRAGEAIGILEREIIFILGIMNQFGAIGFVLAAKSMARFEQLKHQGFAEKYLIGTLLSALIAISCAAIYRT